MDNGPEFVAWALRDWCRLSGPGTVYIEPGSPWENPVDRDEGDSCCGPRRALGGRNNPQRRRRRSAS